MLPDVASAAATTLFTFIESFQQAAQRQYADVVDGVGVA